MNNRLIGSKEKHMNLKRDKDLKKLSQVLHHVKFSIKLAWNEILHRNYIGLYDSFL